MCDCKELENKLKVAENVIAEIGQPYLIYYRVKAAGVATPPDYASYIVGFIVSVALVLACAAFPASSESDSNTKRSQLPSQSQIEL